MRNRWLLFWVSCLTAMIALGAWRTANRQIETQTRGYELATREANVPDRLPLAGVNVELTQYDDPVAELQKIADLGFTWVQQPFLWSALEPEQGVFDWDAADRVVEAVATFDGKLELVAVLDGTPSWARHRDALEHPFAPPASPEQYGEFVRAFAERYGDTVDYYQIWDEPNIDEHWGNLNPRPALYVAMLDAAYDAVHGADAEAMVIMAALAPTTETGPNNINDPDYLRAVYDLGGGDAFDAAAGKPYGFNFSPDDRTVEMGTLNFSRLILLREEMVRQGDGEKPLWGSNFGWNALPENWTGEPSIWGSVTFQQKLEYTHQAFERAATEWAWIGGLILQHWQPNAAPDDPIQGFAIAPTADQWTEIIPRPTVMESGRYPAVNPYADYQGDWEFGDLGADGQPENPPNTITIRFEGTEFSMLVRRGNYLAYLLVTIDGEPANLLPRHNNGDAFIALTDPQRRESVDLIRVADNLAVGEHVAVITHRPEQGQDFWSMAGFAVGIAPEIDTLPRTIAQIVFALSILTILITAVRLPWHNVRLPSVASLRNIGDFLLGLIFSAIVMLGTLLTWHDTLTAALKRDLPTLLVTLATSSLVYFAPSTWIALLALTITGIVIFSRPWIGVLQVLFWGAFFTSNLDPFFRALAMVDALLIITLAATFARLFYDQARQYKQNRAEWWAQVWQLRFHALDVAIVALVVLGIISFTWSEFFDRAFREWRTMILSPALLYMLVRLLKPSKRDLAFLVEAILFTGFMLAFIGILNYVRGDVVVAEGGTRRLLSVYGSPNSVGLMLGRCLPFALAYLLNPVGEWRKIYAGICGATMLIAVALSQSVGALLLGLPAAFVVVLIGWRGRQALPWILGTGVAGIMGLLGLSQFLPRLRQITDFENSTTIFRLNLWRSAMQMIEDYPVTGVGLDHFLYYYRSRYILPEAWRDPDLSHPHNVLLDYWVRLGIFGVILGLSIQFLFWRQALLLWRKFRETDPLSFAIVLGVMGAMADFLAHGLVDMAHFSINLSFMLAVMLALVVQLGVEGD